MKIDAILVTTDFSEPDDYAFKLACSLARDHSAQVFVLHVIPPPSTHGEKLARAAPDSYRDQLWRELVRIKPADASVQVEHLLTEGHPAKEIVQAAKEKGCDLIVMSTHGRTGLSRLLLGSVAEQVLRLATCPVLTVKMPSEEISLAGNEKAGKITR